MTDYNPEEKVETEVGFFSQINISITFKLVNLNSYVPKQLSIIYWSKLKIFPSLPVNVSFLKLSLSITAEPGMPTSLWTRGVLKEWKNVVCRIIRWKLILTGKFIKHFSSSQNKLCALCLLTTSKFCNTIP